ncbi:hypothetical protein BS78_03G336400 [Paspalum vaginatum]|nr:hypothetical protein BS78_03G336400 [Paspalum vaginatum]
MFYAINNWCLTISGNNTKRKHAFPLGSNDLCHWFIRHNPLVELHPACFAFLLCNRVLPRHGRNNEASVTSLQVSSSLVCAGLHLLGAPPALPDHVLAWHQ